MSGLKFIDVVILCGGLGTRLRSKFGETPKVMAPIKGQPFLHLLIDQIVGQGFERVVLCTGYKSQLVEEYFQKNAPHLKVEFSRENTPLGTGGALKNAKGFIKSDLFVVLNGDSICPVDFGEFLKFHEHKKALVSVVVSKVKDQNDFGSVALDQTARISAFYEKLKSEEHSATYVNAGVYCFNQDIFKKMPSEEKFSLEKDFFPTLTKDAFFGFSVKESFLDIGTPERYQAALKALKKG